MRKFLLACLMAFPLALFAQQKVAVVNTSQVMTALAEVKAAETKIQELAKQFDADIKSMQEEYKTKAESLAKEQEGLAEAVRNRRLQELQSIEVNIQQSYQAMQEQLQQEQEKLLAPIRTKINASIKKIADAEGVAYVIEANILLYTGTAAIDITDKIKADLGAK